MACVTTLGMSEIVPWLVALLLRAPLNARGMGSLTGPRRQQGQHTSTCGALGPGQQHELLGLRRAPA
jgi:hypothetical protein